MKGFLSRSTHHGPCRLQDFRDTTQSPCPDWDKGKTSKCQDASSSPNFKLKSSRYSKYEFYLLYFAGVCVKGFLSRSTHHGPCRLQDFLDTTQSPCPGRDKGKTSKCQEASSSPNFKVKFSKYSKYELYLLYLVGVRVNPFSLSSSVFSGPVFHFNPVFFSGPLLRGFLFRFGSTHVFLQEAQDEA